MKLGIPLILVIVLIYIVGARWPGLAKKVGVA